MKIFNFRKVSAIASSVLMMGMTMGIAAASNYPIPFVQSGAADVAIIYGTGTGVSSLDLIQAGNIQTDLQASMGTSTTTTGSVTGEAYALFTGSKKVYLNDALNTVKTSLTAIQLPTVLADGTFEGDVSADVSLKITIGSDPKVTFDNHLTSDDDPTYALKFGTTATTAIYNATTTFDKAVNLTDSDSIGEELILFGQKFTVGAGTTTTNLYLYKSSETISLSVGGSDPTSQTVTVEGETYTVELVSATDTTATIKITDSSGNSGTKEITEDNSKKVQGIDVAVNLADEDTATSRLLAEITVGADKIKLVDGSTVKVGSDEDTIKGTQIVQRTGENWENITQFTLEVFAEDDDVDGILAGGSFTDPVFGSFKVDFAGFNIAEDSATRETIKIGTSSNDKATVAFTDHQGEHTGSTADGTFRWYYNNSVTARLADGTGDVINVIEMAQINKSEYAIIGNEENGYLIELDSVNNETGLSDDYVTFSNVLSGDNYVSQKPADSEGTATISIEGVEYTITYSDSTTNAQDYVMINYADTNTAGYLVVYPTIETSKGAKLAFAEPLTIDLNNWYTGAGVDVSRLYIPDGNGYSQLRIVYDANDTGAQNWTVTPYVDGTTAGTVQTLQTNTTSSILLSIGELKYELSGSTTLGVNTTQIALVNPDDDTTPLTVPSITLIEEQDDSTSSVYNALVITMEGYGTDADGVGVSDSVFSWGDDDTWDSKQLESDNDLYKDADYWGTIATKDDSDSDQSVVTISYPDEQVYPQLYIAEEAASITAGTSGTGASSAALGEVLVKDSEVSSVSTKNLIIVGGSCINSAAATVLGGAYCGSAFTTATNVGSGQFLIKGVSDSTITSKLALVVAGYDVADTVNAATYLRTQTVDTSKEYLGTSSTTATLVTTTA